MNKPPARFNKASFLPDRCRSLRRVFCYSGLTFAANNWAGGAHMTQADLCQRIVEQTQEAIIYADRDGLIRFWNQGAKAMFGYEDEEAIGQSLDLIIPERLRARHWQGYRHVMET